MERHVQIYFREMNLVENKYLDLLGETLEITTFGRSCNVLGEDN